MNILRYLPALNNRKTNLFKLHSCLKREKMSTRAASHAGSWYEEDPRTLSKQLDGWLSKVPNDVKGDDLPIPGARVIIAPHAGYAYSGPAAAWAYKALDLSKAKRIFLLGPSHTLYLAGCAASQQAYYATPLGDLKVDQDTIAELREKGKFDNWRSKPEEDEHSLEMHLPYIYNMLSKTFKSSDDFPLLIPILVGATSANTEKEYGKIFAPYLADPTTIFIISSDFCHWGERFQYTKYLPDHPQVPTVTVKPRDLTRLDKTPTDPPIHESIGHLDKLSMDAITTGVHDEFLRNLRETENTVCGRHPIGVVMAAIGALREDGNIPNGKGRFKFLRYERSNDVMTVKDSSVSYASAVAVL